jgi:hypothetical protein
MHSKNRQHGEHLNLLASDISCHNSISQRADTEAFIRKSFASAYGANVRHFMPILLCLSNSLSKPKAALGLRPAHDTPLYLENYLENPVEDILSSTFQQPVDRKGIVEVGNLAVGEKGEARSLILAMTAFLYAAEYEWVVFTIGPLLINSFTRMGLPLSDLGPARIDQLPKEERDSWGSYYEQDPRVMAGRISDAHDFLRQYEIQETAMQTLWLQAAHIGRLAA